MCGLNYSFKYIRHSIRLDGLTYFALLDNVVGVASGEASTLQQVHHIVLTTAQKKAKGQHSKRHQQKLHKTLCRTSNGPKTCTS